MIISLTLPAVWRDYWGMYNPPAVAQVAALNRTTCLRPRLQVVPDVANQIVPASGKIDYNFYVKPGSIIWGIRTDTAGSTVFQLTDIALNHALFQDPMNDIYVDSSGPSFTTLPGYSILPAPHPVTGDGLFHLEIWAPVGTRVPFLLFVAETIDQ